MLNNRQNGRRRGRGRGPSNGGQRGNESRIDNRARGNAPQMLEKYRNLARDAQLSGDRVMTEYYLQFADHYFRIVAENRARYEENRRQRDDWAEDGEENDESEFRADGAPEDEDATAGRDYAARANGREPRRDSRRPDTRLDQRREWRNRSARDDDRSEPDYGLEGEPVVTANAGPVIDVAVLPPALGVTADAMPDLEEAPTPRRRGRPRKTEVVVAEG